MRIDNSDPRASTLGYASVARRVSLISCLGIATLLIAICALISWLLTEQARQRSVDYMTSEAAAVARVADALDRTARQSADRLYAVLAAELTGSFALQGEAELTHEGQALAGELGLVDRFSAKTGGVATIFARKGEDFMRVTTSLTKQDGSRAMGTLLGSQHPAFAKMMAGGSYVGPATLFGVPFMTRYQAIKDAQGQGGRHPLRRLRHARPATGAGGDGPGRQALRERRPLHHRPGQVGRRRLSARPSERPGQEAGRAIAGCSRRRAPAEGAGRSAQGPAQRGPGPLQRQARRRLRGRAAQRGHRLVGGGRGLAIDRAGRALPLAAGLVGA